MLFDHLTIDGDFVDGLAKFPNDGTWKPRGRRMVRINLGINLVVYVVLTTFGSMLHIETILHLIISFGSGVSVGGQQ